MLTAMAGEEDRNWATARRYAAELLPVLSGLPAGSVLNLNVPDLPPERVQGISRADLADFGQVQITIAETGEGYVRTALEETPETLVPGTDVALLADRYATVTPLTSIDTASYPLPHPYG